MLCLFQFSFSFVQRTIPLLLWSVDYIDDNLIHVYLFVSQNEHLLSPPVSGQNVNPFSYINPKLSSVSKSMSEGSVGISNDWVVALNFSSIAYSRFQNVTFIVSGELCRVWSHSMETHTHIYHTSTMDRSLILRDCDNAPTQNCPTSSDKCSVFSFCASSVFVVVEVSDRYRIFRVRTLSVRWWCLKLNSFHVEYSFSWKNLGKFPWKQMLFTLQRSLYWTIFNSSSRWIFHCYYHEYMLIRNTPNTSFN